MRRYNQTALCLKTSLSLSLSCELRRGTPSTAPSALRRVKSTTESSLRRGSNADLITIVKDHIGLSSDVKIEFGVPRTCATGWTKDILSV